MVLSSLILAFLAQGKGDTMELDCLLIEELDQDHSLENFFSRT